MFGFLKNSLATFVVLEEHTKFHTSGTRMSEHLVGETKASNVNLNYKRDHRYTKWTTAEQVLTNCGSDAVAIFSDGGRDSTQNNERRVAIVTGSNSGIGYVTARTLYRTGYKVICCCRSKEKAETTCAQIMNWHKEQHPHLQHHNHCLPGVLDLGDLDSVRAFCATMQDQRIDILVNNAGIMQLPAFSASKQGFEMQFAVNFLAPWLLTELLTPNLRRAGTETVPSRVVNVSSSAHFAADLNALPSVDCIGDPKIAKQVYTNGWNEYATSKLYQIIHAKQLNIAESKNLVAFSLHPGKSNLILYRVPNLTSPVCVSVCKNLISNSFSRFFFLNVAGVVIFLNMKV